MYYSKIYSKGAGFTNQIFSMITSIIIAHRNNHKVVVIDYFLNDFLKEKYTPISEIFDISEINKFLKRNYNIIIVDKYNIDIQIRITYGTEKSNIDLTDYVIENFCKDNVLCINKDIVLNDIKGDPCIGIKKQLFLNYKINEYLVEEIYEENLTDDISIDILNSDYIHDFAWIDSFDKVMFENILTNISYHSDFTNKSEDILKKINIDNKINVIHLRLEEDAINYWSKMNNLNQEMFQSYIENKYIDLIEKYVSKTDQNIIVSSSLKNKVIDFLIENNYQCIFNDKYFEDREKNAIVDLLVSNYCNHIFIGNFNIKHSNGSTFSYYIGKYIKNDITEIYIDLDKIYEDEYVISSLKQYKDNSVL
jgi:hypothetical protein